MKKTDRDPADTLNHRLDANPCPDFNPQAVVLVNLWEWAVKIIKRIKERLV